MKKLVTALMLCSSLSVFAQDFTPYYKYRVYLTDKKQTEFSVRHPEAFLSQRAIERRNRQGIKIDKTDLPVCQAYLNQISAQGVSVLHKSKWNNTVVVKCTDPSVMSKVEGLPFVSSVKKLAEYKKPETLHGPERKQNVSKDNDVLGRANYPSAFDVNTYGAAYTQIDQLNGVALHGAGFKGQGMVIAVIDGGFLNADVSPELKNTKVLGTKDFIDPTVDFYGTQNHGMNVLSCIGANNPGWQTGTAPEASFWLLRTEEGDTEQLVEEDNWVAAVEFADSVGADVLNSSLGYYDFDNDEDDVTYEQLDGKTHINSRTASMIASKGMILCNSAGNEGNSKWMKIATPADAKDILTVGAVQSNGKIASFSSIGNTADGRVKPDVIAMGQMATVSNPQGGRTLSNGTSFSSPILTGMVACLWQALPQLNAYEIMDIIRKSGDRANDPDHVYGYGVPDFYKAYIMGLVYKQK